MTVMVDRISLALHFPPWEPSSEAELVETYIYYDVPRLGAISDNGELYLFRCVEGFADEIHVWAYAPITTMELATLNEAQGTAELWGVVEEITSKGSLSFAVASDAEGIISRWDERAVSGGISSIMDTNSIMKNILKLAERSKALSPEVRSVLREMTAA
jgi:hypothetical protein